MEKIYERIRWEDSPSANTPLAAHNLNKMDNALNGMDDRIILHNTTKANQSDLLNSVKNVTYNRQTGIFEFEWHNGLRFEVDLNIEKIPVSFEMINGVINMTTEDGTVFTCDIRDMIRTYIFRSSEHIVFTETPSEVMGKENQYYITGRILAGSITEDLLDPAVLAKVEGYATNASSSAKSASTFASNASASATSASESAASAKKDAERAETAAKNAEAVSHVGTATETVAGIMAGGDNAVSEDGTLMLTKVTTDRTLLKSHAGGLKVNRVDGESQQKQYSGKNLLRNTATTQTINGITFTINSDKSVTVNGTATANTAIFINSSVSAEDLGVGSYIFAKNYKSHDIINSIDVYRGSKYVTTIGSDGTIFKITDDLLDCTLKPFFKVISGTTVNNVTVYPMLRDASIEDATYEPYVGGTASPNPSYPQDIKSVVVEEIKGTGKNWLPFQAKSSVTSGVTITTNEIDKSVTVKGTSTAPIYAITIGKFKPIPNKPYKVTVNGLENDYDVYVMMDGSSNWVYGRFTPKTDNIVTCAIYVPNGTTVNKTFRVMISPVEIEDNTYEPYRGEKSIQLSAPITLRGIGDVKDTICKQNGMYVVLKKIIHYNLGDLTWMIRTDITANNKYLYQTGNLPANVKESIGMCSITTNFTKDLWSATENVLSVNSNFLRMGLDTARITSATAENFKAWLAKNNAVADLILATPVFEPLPLADQIALHQLETFDTVTYISTDSEIEPVMEVEYGTSVVGAYAIKGMNDAEVEKLTPPVQPVNNLLATEPGSPLDAVMGKELNDKIVNFSTKEALSIFSKPIIVGCHGGMTIPAHGSFTQTSSLQHVSEKSLLSSFGITDFGDSTIYLPGGLPASVSDSVFSPVFCGRVISPKVDATGLRLINVVARGVEVTKITIINETDEDVVVPAYTGTHNLFVMFYVPTYHTATEQ